MASAIFLELYAVWGMRCLAPPAEFLFSSSLPLYPSRDVLYSSAGGGWGSVASLLSPVYREGLRDTGFRSAQERQL